MLDNLSIEYRTKPAPLLAPVTGISGLMASKDLTIVRLFTSIPGEEKNNVFSKVIFLCPSTYKAWKDNEIIIINERFQSIDYRTERFIHGLEAIESYLENRTVDIDDKDAMSRIRNYIVNSGPSSSKLTSFIDQSISTLRLIVMDGDDIDDFDRISNYHFSPPNPEEEISDFILMEDPDLIAFDLDFNSNDLSIASPDDKDSSITLFSSHQDRDKFFSKIKSLNTIFDEYVVNKKNRITYLLNSGFFKRQLDENTLQASDIPPSAKIIRTIEDETKICNECLRETSSKFCQNIECKSLSPSASIYTIPLDLNINFTVLSYFDFTTPFSNLSNLSNVNKKNAIATYTRDFSDLLNYALLESETSLSICTKNIAHHSFDAEKELATSELSKTAISPSRNDIHGTNVHFWDYFMSGSEVYAIIQHEDEIKTPTLLNEVKKVFAQRKRTLNLEINSDFYKNIVLYVVSDMFGQIKTCREGVLDTSNPAKTLLSLSTNKFSETIRITPTSVRPHISDIMYVPLSAPDNYTYKDKGKHLLSMLSLSELTSDELSEKPEEYRYSRRFYYKLSQGYLMYESSGSLVKVTKTKIPQTLYSGSIDKIRYTRLKEAISYKNFTKERLNLGLQFVKNFMFSPDKSASIFYSNFTKTRAKKTATFKNLVFEKNSLIDCLYSNKSNNILLNEQSQVSKSSIHVIKDYPSYNLEAYKIKNCTPFFMDELFAQPIVNDIIFTIHYNQGSVRNPKLNNLAPFESSFNYNISDFLPINISLSKDKIVTKQLLQNGLMSFSQEDMFTVSLTITLSEAVDFYELTLFERYLSENGVFTQNQTNDYLKISALTGDILAFIL